VPEGGGSLRRATREEQGCPQDQGRTPPHVHAISTTERGGRFPAPSASHGSHVRTAWRVVWSCALFSSRRVRRLAAADTALPLGVAGSREPRERDEGENDHGRQSSDTPCLRCPEDVEFHIFTVGNGGPNLEKVHRVKLNPPPPNMAGWQERRIALRGRWDARRLGRQLGRRGSHPRPRRRGKCEGNGGSFYSSCRCSRRCRCRL
jgi:hypothetical protein